MGKFKITILHLFGIRTFAPVSAAALSGYLSLSDRQMSVDDMDFWLRALGSLVVGLVVWGAMAYDSFEKKQEADDLKQTIEDLCKQVGVIHDNIEASEEELASLTNASNAKLKKMALNLAQEMISLENKFNVTEDRTELYNAANKEEENRVWARLNAEAETRTNHLNSEFGKRYRPKAIAIRNEMRSRLGVIDTQTFEHDVIALDYNRLAGPWPISNAAANLQRLANELPN